MTLEEAFEAASEAVCDKLNQGKYTLKDVGNWSKDLPGRYREAAKAGIETFMKAIG